MRNELLGAMTSVLFPFALWPIALYVICSIRQLIYDLTRHLLYKHFYDCLGPIALLNICSMSKHVICSINIFYKYLIIFKTILLCLRYIKHVTILPTVSLFRQLPGDSL